ncbi:hypothetical protein MMC24_006278 [Lignoscripta atroalba]|nr:hypothetical protein [Lignoscripta atroalba]
MTSSSELTETTLSSAFSLHTSASVKSSSSSLRRRRLAEISEDARETVAPVLITLDASKSDDEVVAMDRGNAQTIVLENKGGITNGQTSWPPNQPFSTSVTNQNLDKSLPAIPGEFVQEREVAEDHPNPFDGEIMPSADRRQSSQSARPTTRDLYNSYGYKPKVKLGPRPSLDYSSRSGSHPRQNEPRPVSTLPAGVRMPPRKQNSNKSQPQQAQSPLVHADNVRLPHSQPFVLPMRSPAYENPATRPESVRNISQFSHYSQPTAPQMTPEKQRLMKALQIRQRQMAKRVREETPSTGAARSLSNNRVSVKVEDHEDALRTLEDASVIEAESDIVHVGMHDLSHLIVANSEVSPISIPEPSDGPSTQASSVTDGEDGASRQLNAVDTDGTGTAESDQCEPSEISGETFVQSIPPQMVAPESQGSQIHGISTTASTLDYPHQILPQDVPLPPIEEDEEMILSTIDDYTGLDQPTPPGQTCADSTQQIPDLLPTSHTVNDDEDLSRTRPSTADTTDFRKMERKERRRGLVDPFRTGSTGENSDDNSFSDDSFMEELKSATVQEAKHISVSRSPIMPVFPKSSRSLRESRSREQLRVSQATSNLLDDSDMQDQSMIPSEEASPEVQRRSSEATRLNRVASNPLESDNSHDRHHLSPELSRSRRPRSISISPPRKGKSKQASPPLAKKLGLSSGISQRIKALEKLSSRETSPGSLSPSTITPPSVSPAFVSLRKSSLNAPPANTGFSDGKGRKLPRDILYHSPSPSPLQDINPPILDSQPIMKAFSSVPQESGPESISVTATIVRDAPNQHPEIPLDPSEPSAMNLHHSPLVVQHQISAPTVSKSLASTNPKLSTTNVSPSLSSEPGPNSIVAPQRISFANKRSTSSRKGSEVDLMQSTSDSSSNSLGSTDNSREDKKESRKSRLLKRMSSISSASRRSLAHALSPTVQEEDPITERHEPTILEGPFVSVDIGDVNIQFPDTLVRIFSAWT